MVRVVLAAALIVGFHAVPGAAQSSTIGSTTGSTTASSTTASSTTASSTTATPATSATTGSSVPPRNSGLTESTENPTGEADASVPLPGYTGGGTVVGSNPVYGTNLDGFTNPVVVRSASSTEGPQGSVERARATLAQRAAERDRAQGELDESLAALRAMDGELALAAARLQRATEAREAARLVVRQLSVGFYVRVDNFRQGQSDALIANESLAGMAQRAQAETLLDGAIDTFKAALAEHRAADAALAELTARRPQALGRMERATQVRDGASRALTEAEEQLRAAELWLTRAEALVADEELLAPLLGRSDLTFPVAGPWEFIDSWGYPRSGGRRHKGTDIFAPHGTPLVAIEDGTVQASSDTLGGLTVYLTGQSGNTYYYAHVAGYHPVAVRGGRVTAGQVLAYCGDTGNAAGGAAHLHLGVLAGGTTAVNPYPLVAALAGAVSAAQRKGAASTFSSTQAAELPLERMEELAELGVYLDEVTLRALAPQRAADLVAAGLVGAPLVGGDDGQPAVSPGTAPKVATAAGGA